MNNFETSYLVNSLLKLFPPLVMKGVMNDDEFRTKYSLTIDELVSYGDSKSQFSKWKLFKAVRDAIESDAKRTSLKDIDGETWDVSIESLEGLDVSISKGDVIFRTDFFWPLIKSVNNRIEKFVKEARSRGLSDHDEAELLNTKVKKENLSNDDVCGLIEELELTPSYIADKLSSEFDHGFPSTPTLVPPSMKYFERLIGKYEGSENITDYANKEFKNHLDSSRSRISANRDLLVSGHPSISQAIACHISDDRHYSELVEEALKIGNPISLTCLIEIGTEGFLEACEPQIRTILERMFTPEVVVQITNLNALILFVDGELSRLQLFKNSPPFYRRLASIAQSSLIVNVATSKDIEFGDIEEWARGQRQIFFYCQSFIDLRKEPRWLPNYLSPSQLRNEFHGRIHNASQKNPTTKFAIHVIEQFNEKLLLNKSMFLPGPLEGNIGPIHTIEEISEEIKASLSTGASLESFQALIASALLWKIDRQHIELAVLILKAGKYQLKDALKKEETLQVINGLALVSALVESKDLAQAVVILTRVYRNYLDVNSEPEHIMAIGLVAASAYKDINDWSNFIGQWFSELTYLPLEPRAIGALKSFLEQLCILEPYLYYTCGKSLEVLKTLERN